MNQTDGHALVPREEIEQRCQKLAEVLAREAVEAALVVQKADLFYCAGTTQQGHLLVGPHAPPLLLVRKSFERAAQEVPLDRVEPLGSFRELPERVRAHLGHAPKRLGLELDVLPVNRFRTYQGLFPDTELVDVSPVLRALRMTKSAYELQCVRGASDILGRVMAVVPDRLREGCSEEELSRELASVAVREGHESQIRMRSWDAEFPADTVVSGPQGAMPGAFDGPVSGAGLGPSKPGGASRRPIGRGEPVLVDMVACSRGYLSDQTRVFCLGTLPAELSRAHSFCLRAMDRLLREGLPGRESRELYDLALGMAEQEGWGQHFMGAGRVKVSFVGHGVGLELDDWPILARGSRTKLEEGMVIAVEPKVVIPGLGAVGIEDTCVVTPQGLEPLTWGERDVVCR
jgi:Xaa-Pro dipeptidase